MFYQCTWCGVAVGEKIHENRPPSSTLDPLSKCNDPPSPHDHRVLLREFKDLLKAIKSLNATIGQLQASIDAFKSRKGELDALVPAYKSAVSLHRRLPNEILTEIFVLCVDRDTSIVNRHTTYSDRNNDYPSTLDTKKSPWVLSQICARWRNLALSLPKLWSAIDLSWEPELTQIPHVPFIERRLVQTLQRAGNSPLSVSWCRRSCRDTTLSILCSRSYQWKEARIRIPADQLRVLTPYSGMFSALTSLDPYLEGRDGATVTPNGPSVFHMASKLRKLALCSDSMIRANQLWQFPLRQITTLNLMPENPFATRLTYESLQMVLPCLTNVESCSIGSFDFVRDHRKPPLTLPRLHSLQLVAGKFPAIDSFLQSVTLPSLRTLVISPQSSLPFTEFLKRSACTIESLSLGHVTDDVLLEILQAKELQAARQLSVAGSTGLFLTDSISDAVLRVLTFQVPAGASTEKVLFPHLEELTLAGTRRYSDTALVDLLLSRRNISHFTPGAVSPLRHIRIRLYPEHYRLVIRDEVAKSKLRGLIEGGLLVTETQGGLAVVV